MSLSTADFYFQNELLQTIIKVYHLIVKQFGSKGYLSGRLFVPGGHLL